MTANCKKLSLKYYFKIITIFENKNTPKNEWNDK